MLHRILFSVALSLLLGFSQQSALLHSVSHISDHDTPHQLAQELTPELAKEQQDKGTHQATHCDHCIGFSHLASIISSNNGLAIPATSHVSPDNLVLTTEYLLTSLAYSARAPPTSI